MFKNIEIGTRLRLQDLVDYQPDQVVSRTLTQNDKISMTLFALDTSREISTQSSSGDAMVTVLEGTGTFIIGDTLYRVPAGETLIMPREIPHTVRAEEPFKMQMTVML